MDEKSSYYVATSIPYVNAVPHIGFAYELVIADTLARYWRLHQKDIFFSTGADEHGGKIETTAKEQNITPAELAEKNAQAFTDLAPVMGVEYTRFIRTSSPEHESRAAQIWQQMGDLIYKGKYSGLYDTREESFITHEEAKQLMKDDPARYDRLEKIEEENYFFKLSSFAKPLLEAIVNDDIRVVPQTRKNEMVALVKSGLQDISVSRPAEKIGWGIPVPGDPTQNIYVWFEALMNYITTLGYPDGADFAKFWPCDTHVIGKDISRFHVVIWPAMLMALKLDLPKEIYVHGFITVGGEKMSKSVGNVISPLDLVANYGTDPARYYLLRHIPSHDDGDFTWEKMEAAYNNELGNELGNLVGRVATMAESYLGGKVGKLPDSTHDEEPYHTALGDYRFDRALDHVWTMIKGLNQYIDEQKPWLIAKEISEADHLAEVLGYLSGALLQISELLAPFMPTTAKIIYDTFSADVVKKPEVSLFPRTTKQTQAS